MKVRMIATFLFSTFCLISCTAAIAKNHTVKLLTTGENGQTMVMSPGFLKVASGDTVTFVPADVTHNVESLAVPQNANPFSSAMGKEVTITFTEPGVYLYKCTPHFSLGMLGVIQVDEPVNLAKVEQVWASINAGVVLNKERVAQYLSEVK